VGPTIFKPQLKFFKFGHWFILFISSWIQYSGSREGVSPGFSLNNYGKQIFSFFNHIVHKMIVLSRIGVLNGNMESIGTIYPPYPPQFMHLSQLQVQDCWAVNTKLQVLKGMFTTFVWFPLLEDVMKTIKPFFKVQFRSRKAVQSI